MKQRAFLWVDLCAAGLSAAGTAAALYVCWRYLSFAGFASLLGVVVLLPGFVCLLAEVLLLALSLRGRARAARMAFLLQILCGVPYTLLFLCFPAGLWVLSVHMVLLVLGSVGAARMC